MVTSVQTPFGPVDITLSDKDRMFVDANSGGKSIKINGVKIGTSFTLVSTDDVWRLVSDSLYATKREWTRFSQSHVSASARNKIINVLVPYLAKWAEENIHESQRAEAEVEAQMAQLNALNAQIAKLETEQAALYAKRHDALAAIREASARVEQAA